MSTSRAPELQQWATGDYAREAAIELLTRFSDGRLLLDSWPWIAQGDHGTYFFDTEQVTEEVLVQIGGAGERVLIVATGLMGGSRASVLGTVVCSLDEQNLDLVLAAFSHATGIQDRGRAVHPWPHTH